MPLLRAALLKMSNGNRGKSDSGEDNENEVLVGLPKTLLLAVFSLFFSANRVNRRDKRISIFFPLSCAP